MTTKTDNKTIKQLRQSLRTTVKELKSFEDVSLSHTNVILAQDAVSKELSKKNKIKLDKFLNANYTNKTDKKLNDITDIIFRNFDIQTATIEIMKTYIDEHTNRFKLLNKHLSKTLLLLDKTIADSFDTD